VSVLDALRANELHQRDRRIEKLFDLVMLPEEVVNDINHAAIVNATTCARKGTQTSLFI
jgi:hypothetical protein